MKSKWLISLGLVVCLVAAFALPACVPKAPEEEVTPPAEEIKYGGRLNVGFSAAQDSLIMDNALMHSSWGCLYLMLVYDNLAHYTEMPYGTVADTYTLSPKLLKSYEVSEDGTTWTMHLVENAKWHDGVPFTAEDVAFTFEYLYQTPGWGGPDRVFEEIEIIDDYTIKAVHDIPLSPITLRPWWLWDPVIPKHIFEPHKNDILSFPNEESIGTGAFKLKEFKLDQYMWLEANEDYWGGRPYVDEVVFILYPTAETMFMALESGEVDVLGNMSLPPPLVEDFEANPNVKVELVPDILEIYLAFNLHKDTPLRDKDVRHAIAYGIDRDRLIDMAWAGYAERIDGWVYPESQMHKPDLPQYDYNPDKANEILDEAGYLDTDGDGIRNDPTTGENLVFDLATASAFSERVKACTLIAEMLPAIGIGVEFSAMDSDAFWEYFFDPTTDKLDMGVDGSGPTPDPWSDWIWEICAGWGSGGEYWNASYYDNPRYNQLHFDNMGVKDLETKKEILYEMQDILAEDLPLIFLARPDFICVYRTDKFEGWVNEIGGTVSWMNDWSILKVHLK